MRSAFPRLANAVAAGALVIGLAFLVADPVLSDEPSGPAGVSHALVAKEALPNLPGNTLTAVTVELAPGAASPAHRHAGFVFAYVLAGEVRSRLDDGPATIYRVGESWVEPPGTVHSLTENPSRTDPARLLAVFVAPDGAKLTTPAR